MCHREGLYQIDLLNGSKNRVTEREYWAQKKGQAALDKQNAPMLAEGITPRQTKFETNKEKLRQTIRAALVCCDLIRGLFLSAAAGGRDRQGEPGAALLPHAGQDEAHYRPESGQRF